MSKQSRPWTRRQRRAIRQRAGKQPGDWRSMRRPRAWSGGRGIAETIALDLRLHGPVNPHLFGSSWPTSTRRRWSQILRVAMKPERPHPRPWEGPRMGVNFNGLFIGIGHAAGPDWSATVTVDEILAGIEEVARRLTEDAGPDVRGGAGDMEVVFDAYPAGSRQRGAPRLLHRWPWSRAHAPG